MRVCIGVLCVASIVAISALVATSGTSSPSRSTLATRGTFEGAVLDDPSLPRSQTIEERPEATEATEAGKAQETPRLGTKNTGPETIGCQCEDCQCPDPMICKNGHCKQRYAIVFSTHGCIPCTRMYPVIQSLRKQGHAVYYFDDYFSEVAKRYNVNFFPTTVIFDGGHEVDRFIGLVTKQTLKEALCPPQG